MKEVYINVVGLEIEELFDSNIVSIEELVQKIIELNTDTIELKKKTEELKEYKEQYCDKYSFD